MPSVELEEEWALPLDKTSPSGTSMIRRDILRALLGRLNYYTDDCSVVGCLLARMYIKGDQGNCGYMFSHEINYGFLLCSVGEVELHS